MALLAIDIGTPTARAGLLARDGTLLSAAGHAFPLLRPAGHQAAYRFADIWRAVAAAVRACTQHKEEVEAIAIDATCSIVLSHAGPPPLEEDADVICWMDHRAEAEADEIARMGHKLLDATGRTMSPELYTPKLAWLARHAPAAWARVTNVWDLCDPEPVLLGTAMVAATAAGLHGTLLAAQDAMAWPETSVPAHPAWATAHDLAYAAYLRLWDARAAVDEQAALLQRMEVP